MVDRASKLFEVPKAVTVTRNKNYLRCSETAHSPLQKKQNISMANENKTKKHLILKYLNKYILEKEINKYIYNYSQINPKEFLKPLYDKKNNSPISCVFRNKRGGKLIKQLRDNLEIEDLTIGVFTEDSLIEIWYTYDKQKIIMNRNIIDVYENKYIIQEKEPCIMNSDNSNEIIYNILCKLLSNVIVNNYHIKFSLRAKCIIYNDDLTFHTIYLTKKPIQDIKYIFPEKSKINYSCTLYGLIEHIFIDVSND
jgi:hypothetical protein